MAKPPTKYKAGAGGKRLQVVLNDEEFKEFEEIREYLNDKIGIDTDKAVVVASIKHLNRHIKKGEAI